MPRSDKKAYEFVAIGDTQFHPWQEGVAPLLWKKMPEALNTAAQYAIDNEVDDFVFLGDLFEHKSRPRMDVVVKAIECWRYAVHALFQAGVHVHALAGNHDYCDGQYSSDLLQWRDYDDFVRIHNSVASWWEESIPGNTWKRRVVALPNRAAFPKLHDPTGVHRVVQPCSYDVLFCHGEIPTLPMGPGVRSNVPDYIGEEFLNTFRLVVNGHYHDHSITNLGDTMLCNVGAPFHHNWSDTDSPRRGFIHGIVPAGGTPTITHIPLKGYPRFVSTAANAQEGDFVAPEKTLQQKNITPVRGQKSLEAIAQRDMSAALGAYVDHKEKGAAPKYKKHVVEVGIALTKGDTV